MHFKRADNFRVQGSPHSRYILKAVDEVYYYGQINACI
jgi:hypothetical protein